MIAPDSIFVSAKLINISADSLLTHWSTGETTRDFNICTAGNYWVIVGYANDCVARDTVIVTACQLSLVIPNVVPSNRDDDNELFPIQTIAKHKFQLHFFHPLDRLILDDIDYRNTWNATAHPAGLPCR